MPGLPTQVVSLPLRPLNQKAPKSVGPAGRLEILVDGVVKKIADGQIAVSKRDGFQKLSRVVRNAASAALISSTAGVPSPRLLSSLDQETIAISNEDIPYVLGENGWEKYVNDIVLTQRLEKTVQYTTDAQISVPDGARAGAIWMYVWKEGAACRAMVVDSSGTVQRQPFQVAASGRIKIVSDGTYFYVFYDTNSTTVRVTIYDTTGTDVSGAHTVDTLDSASQPWDVTYQPSIAVMFVRELLTPQNLRLIAVIWAGAPISIIVNDIVVPFGPRGGGLSFMFNENTTGHCYVAIARLAESGLVMEILAYKLTVSTLAQFYDIAINRPLGISNITGYCVSGSSNVWVSWTQENLSNIPMNAQTYSAFCLQGPSALVSGAATTPVAKKSVTVASRVFKLGSRYVFVAYYASVPSQYSTGTGGSGGNVQQYGQPTFFLVDVVTNQTVGRFDWAMAAMDWTRTGWNYLVPATAGANFWQLPSVFLDASGYPHVPLGYRAVSMNSTRDLSGGRAITTNTSTIGLADYAFKAPGKAVEYGGELLLPGPIAIAFTGVDFPESNFNLQPEVPTLTGANGGLLTLLASYEYVIVYEATAMRGARVFSAPCLPVGITLGGSANQVNLVIPTLRVSRRTRVKISIYRTFIAAATGLSDGTFHKVTNDLSPLYNDPTADTVSYSDQLSDVACASGEELYTDGDPAVLGRYPAPPFHAGGVFERRMFLAGYDGSVWFSGEKNLVDNLALSWHPDFIIGKPTNERVTGLAPMDGRIVLGCERSVWHVPSAGWPDPTGSGTIPVPERLPFANGSTGPIFVAADGAFYESSQGGPWLIDRALSNDFAGAPVEDEALTPGLIYDITIDKHQRVCFATAAKILAFDTVVKCWYTWTAGARLLHVRSGQLLFTDNTDMWVQALAAVDDAGSAISTRMRIAGVGFAGVAGYERTKRIQLYGQKNGRHKLNVGVQYDLAGLGAETFPAKNSDDIPTGASYRWDLRPAKQKCQQVALDIYDSFAFTDTITHDADDAVVALTRTWRFDNGAFVASDVGGLLIVAGTVAPGNSNTFVIESVVDSTHVVTAAGPVLVNETFGVGVTATKQVVTPSAGYTLENIGLEIATKKGTGKLSRAQRIAPT